MGSESHIPIIHICTQHTHFADYDALLNVERAPACTRAPALRVPGIVGRQAVAQSVRLEVRWNHQFSMCSLPPNSLFHYGILRPWLKQSVLPVCMYILSVRVCILMLNINLHHGRGRTRTHVDACVCTFHTNCGVDHWSVGLNVLRSI